MRDAGRIRDALLAVGIDTDIAVLVDNTVQLRMPSGTTPEQQTAAEEALVTVLDSLELNEGKAVKQARLDLWYARVTAGGIEVGGMIFDATIEAQNRMDAMTSMINAAKSYGYGDDSSMYTIFARGGVAITLPAAALIGLMLQYGQTVAYLSGVYAAAQSAINAATTVEEVDAIVLPGPVAGASPWPSIPSALPFLSAGAKPG